MAHHLPYQGIELYSTMIKYLNIIIGFWSTLNPWSSSPHRFELSDDPITIISVEQAAL